ncbi:FliM/FliN family flagellar motor switch protein [Marinicaulis aureus]|uniref:FliM/FliN family flagellar motor switch protein n=1 Tax=Hyphococcus aureus TaxID=2666033 RepID=A0ABW1KYF0_9PROT
MSGENAKIIKKKMAASGKDPGPLHLIADLPQRMGAEAAGAFTEFYGEKCQLAETEPAHFANLDDALTDYAGKDGIYHFRYNIEQDFIIVLDIDTSLRAAGWSLAGAKDMPDPMPDSVSAIDRRLAKKLAIRSAELIFSKADAAGVMRGSVELMASGNDPRRFDFTDEKQRVVCATYSVKTLEEETLGTIRVIAPERLTVAMRDYYDNAVPRAQAKWKSDLLKLAAMSPIELRADLTEEDITLGTLMNLAPGQVINLTTATIDEITVYSALPTKSKLQLMAALGNRDGARALKIKSVAY